MRKSIVCGCGIMVAALVIGCGSGSSPSSPEAVIKEQTSIQAQMTGIMEKVTDKKSFEEAKFKIKELSKRSEDLAKGFTEDQLVRAAEKFKTESEASFKKYQAAYGAAMLKASPKSAKKEKGGDGSDVDQKKEIKFDMSYLEKKWGIKYKSHSFKDVVVLNKGPNEKKKTVKELRIVLEFTKDVDLVGPNNFKELRRAFTPDEPIQLWFEFFDKDNVSLGKHFPQRMPGSEFSGKKGDVFEVFPQGPEREVDPIPKVRKIEARPGEGEKDKSGSTDKK